MSAIGGEEVSLSGTRNVVGSRWIQRGPMVSLRASKSRGTYLFCHQVPPSLPTDLATWRQTAMGERTMLASFSLWALVLTVTNLRMEGTLELMKIIL